MSEHIPDKWEVVRLKFEDVDLHKVLASWYGGFAGADEWRLSSGIVSIVDHENHYEIHNETGSVYQCHKKTQGTSGYTFGVFQKMAMELEERGGSVVMCDIANILDKYPPKSEPQIT